MGKYDQHTTVTIAGKNFGSIQPTVEIDSLPATVTSFTDTQIVIDTALRT
jgi:hypothetical protein